MHIEHILSYFEFIKKKKISAQLAVIYSLNHTRSHSHQGPFINGACSGNNGTNSDDNDDKPGYKSNNSDYDNNDNKSVEWKKLQQEQQSHQRRDDE